MLVFSCLFLGLLYWQNFSAKDYLLKDKSRLEIIPTNTDTKYIPDPLSLEKIFQDDHSWTATLSAEKIRFLISTGDVIPARSVNFQTVKRNNFLWPFEKTADFLRQADLTVINLESPLVQNCPLTQTGMIFCGDPGNIEGLVFAGVDVATLANNHSLNFGRKGLDETIGFLKSAGIEPVFDNILVKEVRGMKFAFLAFNDLEQNQYTVTSSYEQEISAKVSLARQQADIVIISFHWGAEYVRYPAERLRKLAHLAIDSGADLILGNHPHWVQGIEIYKDKLINYAQGNFVFDQMWSLETRRGVVAKFTFYEDKLIDALYIPIYISDYGQPDFADEAEKNRILAALEEASLVIKNNLSTFHRRKNSGSNDSL